MPDWGLWLIAAALLAGGEVATTSFFLGPLALAALAGALVALLGLGLPVQIGVFIAAGIAAILLLRPVAMRHLRTPARLRTGVAALVGSRAVVVERVDADGGRVKIGGEVWSARSFFDDQVIEAGTRVEVAKIEGATALVFDQGGVQ